MGMWGGDTEKGRQPEKGAASSQLSLWVPGAGSHREALETMQNTHFSATLLEGQGNNSTSLRRRAAHRECSFPGTQGMQSSEIFEKAHRQRCSGEWLVPMKG